eukprot:11870677-Alexandrium_andersonii.AAC.1
MRFSFSARGAPTRRRTAGVSGQSRSGDWRRWPKPAHTRSRSSGGPGAPPAGSCASDVAILVHLASLG